MSEPPTWEGNGGYSSGVRSQFRKLLHDSWEDLADQLDIGVSDRAKFRDDPARRLWDYLSVRGRLGELPAALGAIERNDLANLLARDGQRRRPRSDSDVGPIDRHDESEQFRAALLTGDRPVVVVRGTTGIGKSDLVDFITDELAHEIRVITHQLGPGRRYTAARLIEDLEERPLLLRSGESLTTRLRFALDRSCGQRIAIVVDGAQYLVDSARKIPLDLDDALDTLVGHLGHHVKVVLVTTREPESGAGTRAFSNVEHVPLGGLPREWFPDLFRRIDPGREGLARLPADEVGAIHQVLEGNPRRVKVLNALLSTGQADITVSDLIAELEMYEPDRREKRLVERLVRELTTRQQDVLEALTVFAVPVELAVLATMVEDRYTRGQVADTVDALTRKHLIASTTDSGVYLQVGTGELVLRALVPDLDVPDDTGWTPRRELLRIAANALSDHPLPVEDVAALAGLDLHFEQLRLWLEAGLHEVAFPCLEAIDDKLSGLKPSGLLRYAREQVRGRIGDDFLEMINANGLGGIYSQEGDLGPAEAAFATALNLGRKIGWSDGRRKIMTNLGSLAWEAGDLATAEDRYAMARAMAEEFDADRDLMYALEGEANCLRRRGAYTEALARAEEALAAAQRIADPNAVALAARLSRWYTDLGWDDHAERRLATAETEARESGERAVHALDLDARADFLLAAGRWTEAADRATDAVNTALKVGDAITLLQARTTLGVAYLLDGKLGPAAREILAAGRQRQPGRSLIVLAFQAVIELLRGDQGEANRLFRDLRTESADRIVRDHRDFSAWDLAAVAVCGLHEGDFRRIAAALFAQARRGTDRPVPGLTARLVILLDLIRRYAGLDDIGSIVTAAEAHREVQAGS